MLCRTLTTAAWIYLVVWLLACGEEQNGVPAAPNTVGQGGAASGGAGGSAGQGGSAQAGMGGSGGQRDPWQPVETPWCTGDWVGLDEDTCFYASTTLSDSAELLVFLHGMMPPDSLPTTMQSIVAQEVEARGAVALFPKGKAGLCSWDESVKDWYCWPTSRANVDTHSASLTGSWDAAATKLSAILETSFTRRYVLGFSNGGYFASYLGLEGLWPLEGSGLVAAGRSFVDEKLLSAQQPPMYIAVGELDQLQVQQSAENLAYVLSLHNWPHQFIIHSQRGHEIWPDDVQAAWKLWTAPQ